MKEARVHAHDRRGEIPTPWPLMTAMITLFLPAIYTVYESKIGNACF